MRHTELTKYLADGPVPIQPALTATQVAAESVILLAVDEVFMGHGLEEVYDGNYDQNPLPAGIKVEITDRVLDWLIHNDLLVD